MSFHQVAPPSGSLVSCGMGEQCSKLPSFEDEEREVGPSGEYRRDDDRKSGAGRVCCQGPEDHDIDDDDDPAMPTCSGMAVEAKIWR